MIDDDSEESGYSSSSKYLVYGRCGPKFRISVVTEIREHGEPDMQDQTLWSNCPRDLKLLAYTQLPRLLDKLIESVEGTLEQVEFNTETIQALLPSTKQKGGNA